MRQTKTVAVIRVLDGQQAEAEKTIKSCVDADAVGRFFFLRGPGVDKAWAGQWGLSTADASLDSIPCEWSQVQGRTSGVLPDLVKVLLYPGELLTVGPSPAAWFKSLDVMPVNSAARLESQGRELQSVRLFKGLVKGSFQRERFVGDTQPGLNLHGRISGLQAVDLNKAQARVSLASCVSDAMWLLGEGPVPWPGDRPNKPAALRCAVAAIALGAVEGLLYSDKRKVEMVGYRNLPNWFEVPYELAAKATDDGDEVIAYRAKAVVARRMRIQYQQLWPVEPKPQAQQFGSDLDMLGVADWKSAGKLTGMAAEGSANAHDMADWKPYTADEIKAAAKEADRYNPAETGRSKSGPDQADAEKWGLPPCPGCRSLTVQGCTCK